MAVTPVFSPDFSTNAPHVFGAGLELRVVKLVQSVMQSGGVLWQQCLMPLVPRILCALPFAGQSLLLQPYPDL